MTGRLRKLYSLVGMTILFLLTLAILVAGYRAAPDQEEETDGKTTGELSVPGQFLPVLSASSVVKVIRDNI